MGKNDFLYLNAQLRNGHNEKKIIRNYDLKQVEDWSFKMLEMIGFEKKQLHYGARLNNDEMECYFTVKSVPYYLEYLGIEPGHEIIVVTSRKPTLEEFRKQLASFDSRIWLNDAKDFAIAVCRLK
jgi:hypothetical protein